MAPYVPPHLRAQRSAPRAALAGGEAEPSQGGAETKEIEEEERGGGRGTPPPPHHHCHCEEDKEEGEEEESPHHHNNRLEYSTKECNTMQYDTVRQNTIR